jgi:hypothetical protein
MRPIKLCAALALIISVPVQAQCALDTKAADLWAWSVGEHVKPTNPDTAPTVWIAVTTKQRCSDDEIAVIRRTLGRELSRTTQGWRPIAMDAPAQKRVFEFIETAGLANIDATTDLSEILCARRGFHASRLVNRSPKSTANWLMTGRQS